MTRWTLATPHMIVSFLTMYFRTTEIISRLHWSGTMETCGMSTNSQSLSENVRKCQLLAQPSIDDRSITLVLHTMMSDRCKSYESDGRESLPMEAAAEDVFEHCRIAALQPSVWQIGCNKKACDAGAAHEEGEATRHSGSAQAPLFSAAIQDQRCSLSEDRY